jgi:hypothetical protein
MKNAPSSLVLGLLREATQFLQACKKFLSFSMDMKFRSGFPLQKTKARNKQLLIP